MEMTTSTTNATRPVVFANPPGSDNFAAVSVSMEEMNAEIMDTAFTKAVGCDGFPDGCLGMARYYRFGETVPLGKHWKHKYLVDFDGMSYSGRALSFLASESVLVKSTVYREFYSDWIQPWYVMDPRAQALLTHPFLLSFLVICSPLPQQATFHSIITDI